MSLEAEMMLEQLKEQHLQETEVLQNQLESKVGFAEENLKVYQLFPGWKKKTTLLALRSQPAAKTNVIFVLCIWTEAGSRTPAYYCLKQTLVNTVLNWFEAF